MLAIDTLKIEIEKKKKELEVAHSDITRIENEKKNEVEIIRSTIIKTELEIKELEHGILLLSTGETCSKISNEKSEEKVQKTKSTVIDNFEIGDEGRTVPIYREIRGDMMEVIATIPDEEWFKSNIFKDVSLKHFSHWKNPMTGIIIYIRYLIKKKIIESNREHGSGLQYRKTQKVKDISLADMRKRIEQERQLQRDVLGK